MGTGNNYPGSPGISLNLFTVQTNTGHVDKGLECYGIDENFLSSLNIPVVKGRNFSGPADTLHSIMVNESLVKHFRVGQCHRETRHFSRRYFQPLS
ncbi:MAG: hypothetical protein WDM78_04975 [Puia sp.]